METLQRMFEHLDWANQRIAERLCETGGEPAEALRLFAHTLGAEQVWLTRLEGRDSRELAIWPEGWSAEDCAKLAVSNRSRFTALLSSLAAEPARLETPMTYNNSKGTPFTNTPRDILTHVALHGQYHRGQINTLFRQKGFEPASLDYILFVRYRGHAG